jgi:hypothetical protein
VSCHKTNKHDGKSAIQNTKAMNSDTNENIDEMSPFQTVNCISIFK